MFTIIHYYWKKKKFWTKRKKKHLFEWPVSSLLGVTSKLMHFTMHSKMYLSLSTRELNFEPQRYMYCHNIRDNVYENFSWDFQWNIRYCLNILFTVFNQKWGICPETWIAISEEQGPTSRETAMSRTYLWLLLRIYNINVWSVAFYSFNPSVQDLKKDIFWKKNYLKSVHRSNSRKNIKKH